MGNVLQFLRHELADRWSASADGRIEDVPFPGEDRLFVGEVAKQVRVSRASPDYIVLTSGTTQKEPRGFGHTHRRSDNTVTISCRSAHSRERVFGARDDSNDCEDYGGLVGEVERILDEMRGGDKEFDRIHSGETRDVSNLAKESTWRGEVEASLEVLAEVIDP